MHNRKLFQEMSQLLRKSVDQVVSHMLGLPIKPASFRDLREEPSALLICSVAFDGAVSGDVTLYLPEGLVNLLVQKIGFVPLPDAIEPTCLDIIGELLNMMVGQTLSRMANSSLTYFLSTPRFLDRKDDFKNHLNSFPAYLCTCSCLDHLFMFRLQWNSSSAPSRNTS